MVPSAGGRVVEWAGRKSASFLKWCWRALNKLLSIMDNHEHPLHHLVDRQGSTLSNRLAQLRCHKDR